MSKKQMFIIWSDNGLNERELLGMLNDCDGEQDFSVCDIHNSIDHDIRSVEEIDKFIEDNANDKNISESIRNFVYGGKE